MGISGGDLWEKFKWIALVILFSLLIGTILVIATSILDGVASKFALVMGGILLTVSGLAVCCMLSLFCFIIVNDN